MGEFDWIEQEPCDEQRHWIAETSIGTYNLFFDESVSKDEPWSVEFLDKNADYIYEVDFVTDGEETKADAIREATEHFNNLTTENSDD